MPSSKHPLRFESGRLRAGSVTIISGIAIVLSVASIVSTLLEINLLQNLPLTQIRDPASLTANDQRQQIIAIAQVVITVCYLVVLLLWTHRAQRNLVFLASGTAFSPGWAAAYFLIPIVNLYRPYQVYKQFWQASDPTANFDAPLEWKSKNASSWIGIWWVLWILGNYAARFMGRYIQSTDTLESFVNADWAFISLDVIQIATFSLTIYLVLKIDRMQILKYERRREYVARQQQRAILAQEPAA